MQYIYLLAGMVLGAAGGVLMLKLRTTRLALELSAVQARYSEAKEQLALLSAQASAAVAQNHQLSL